MNAELKTQLQAYLQRLIDHPDDKYQLPVYVTTDCLRNCT